MGNERLYEVMQPENASRGGRAFRLLHHAMVALGIAIMLANTEPGWRAADGLPLDIAFRIPCAFFIAEYALRLIAAAAAPGAESRSPGRLRLAYVVSAGGILDLASALPGFVAILHPDVASLCSFIWVFKYIRYAPGLTSLRRVFSHARHALLSVLLGFGIVLLAAASLAYLFERGVDHPGNPGAFASIPAALWWAIVTLTTTGYGDAIPQTLAGRMLAGVVMVSGIMVFALWAGILATGYADEMRRRHFLRTWDLVAKVPFFDNVGAGVIAEVARLLRPRDYPAGAVIVRRGEAGDCMYFIAEGEVEVRLRPESLFLGTGAFFGEIALLTGGPRNATIVAARPCTLLLLDIVDFRDLLARQPDLARIIRDEAKRRLDSAAPAPAAEAAMTMDVTC